MEKIQDLKLKDVDYISNSFTLYCVRFIQTQHILSYGLFCTTSAEMSKCDRALMAQNA